MSTHHHSELGAETEEYVSERRLESLDDITREIADRRLTSEYAEVLPPERLEILRNLPDRIESPEDFSQAATKAGIQETDGVLGWSTDLESPAHVRQGDVPVEIATLIHEDLHRVTAPETMREMTDDPALRELYEGITEFFTERAANGLHEHESGECYPEQVKAAEKLSEEVGETALRDFFFKHELTDEVQAAIRRVSGNEPAA